MQPYMFSKQDEERKKMERIFNQSLRYVDYYHNELLKNEKLF